MRLAICSANCINGGSDEVFERACALVQPTPASTCVKLASTCRLINYTRLVPTFCTFLPISEHQKTNLHLIFSSKSLCIKIDRGGEVRSLTTSS